MTNKHQKVAACCVVVADDGKFLAVSRKNDPTDFGFPGGKIDPGETPKQAARRELREETGLIATDLRLLYVSEDEHGYVTYSFLTEVEGTIDTSESGVIRWVTADVLLAGSFSEYNHEVFKRLKTLK